MVPTAAVPANEAHKTEPDKNTYLVFDNGLRRRRSPLRLRDALPLPGSRGRHAGLHHAHQPRRRRGASRDAARHAGRRRASRSRRSTARPGTRGRSGCCSRPRTQNAPTYAATPGYPSTVEDVSGALGRGGYEGIQDDSDGNIWIVEDIGGANKPGTIAADAEQLRLPLRTEASGRPAQRQAPGAAGAARRRARRSRRRRSRRCSRRTRWRCTRTARSSTPVGSRPRHRRRRPRVRSTRTHAAKLKNGTPFKRPENGLFRPGSQLRGVLLRRDRRHERDQRRERLLRRLDLRLQADAEATRRPTPAS